MVAERFPLFRLVTLLARQLSAPIASRIKIHARANPRFGRWVCMATGRAFYECELRFRMWTLALRQPRTVPPLADQAALDAGADILGEIVVFAIGGLIITLEVNRQANIQEEKELDEKSKWLAMLLELEELQRELNQQQQDIDRLQEVLRQLASQYSSAAASLPAPPTPTLAAHASTLEQHGPTTLLLPEEPPSCMRPPPTPPPSTQPPLISSPCTGPPPPSSSPMFAQPSCLPPLRPKPPPTPQCAMSSPPPTCVEPPLGSVCPGHPCAEPLPP